MVDTNELPDDTIVLEDEDTDAAIDSLELADEEGLKDDKIKALRVKLKQCEEERKNAVEERERVRADFLNSKRRLEEQFKNDRERVVDRVVSDFLPLIDSFETALSHSDQTGSDWEKGVRAMHAQFIAILKGYGIGEIECEGQLFNPHEHEAVTSRKAEDAVATDTIIQVLQRGYKRGDTIIRPAKVVIAE
jgi:molecular chaperone GrpE